MRPSLIIKLCASLGLISLLVACAAGPGTSARVATGTSSSAAPICIGAGDCQNKMNAARSWIAANSGLGLVVDTSDTLETGGWGMPAYTSVRVERRSLGGDRYWIIANIQCGNSAGGICSDTGTALADFNATVSAAF